MGFLRLEMRLGGFLWIDKGDFQDKGGVESWYRMVDMDVFNNVKM